MLTLLWPWPANSGGRIRTAAICQALDADYDVTVLGADHAGSGFPAWDAGVRRVLARRGSGFRWATDIIEAAALGDHTAARRAVHSGLPAAFGEILGDLEPNLVVLGPPFFGPFIDAARVVGARVILDPNERLAGVARRVVRARHIPFPTRLRAALESWSLARMERREYVRADAVWVASERERERFHDLVPNGVVKVVPNPVLRMGEVAADGQVRAVAFLGWYGHAPNEAAALELITLVMPAIRRAGGPNRLMVIGRGPTSAMRKAAARNSGTDITGEVPDALGVLADAGLLAMPIRSGGGTRVKVLEAASVGVPIVSTEMGVEGLNFEPGVHYMRAETPAEFGEAVAMVTRDAALRARLVDAARELVQAHYGPQAVLDAVRASLGT